MTNEAAIALILHLQIVRVSLAAEGDLAGFAGQEGHCHENCRRWVRHHPDDHIARGFLYTAHNCVARHSVVRRSDGTMLDITPRIPGRDRTSLKFAEWIGNIEDFDSLPAQLFLPATVKET